MTNIKEGNPKQKFTPLGQAVIEAKNNGGIQFADRWLPVEQKTRLVTTIGKGHSKTRAAFYHNAVAEFLNKSGVPNQLIHLPPVELEPEEVEQALREVFTLGMAGVTVTMPYKQDAYQFIQKNGRFGDGDEATEISGAVNTVVAKTNKGEMEFWGYNTDIDGFLGTCKVAGVQIKGVIASIIGCGGFGRSVATALALNGAAKIQLYDSEMEKARQLATALKAQCERHQLETQLNIVPQQTVEDCLKDSTFVIHCTGLCQTSPIPKELLKPSMAFLDANYASFPGTQPTQDAILGECWPIIPGTEMANFGNIRQHQLFQGFELTPELERQLVEVGRGAFRTALINCS